MDFTYPPEARGVPQGVPQLARRQPPARPRGPRARRLARGRRRARSTRLRDWNRTLADARYAAIAWPEEWGGRGAGVMEQVVYAEEMHRAGAPGTLNPLGLSNIAPAIIEHGTDEQKRTLLPRMLRGDDIWCQGFSEPNAGSDLASLRTAAVRDGDVLDRQRAEDVEHARPPRELVRAARPHRSERAEAQGHHVPARRHDAARASRCDRSPRSPASKEFNEIFFTDVRVPVDCTLGPVDERLARRDDDPRLRAGHRRQAAPRDPAEDPAAHRRRAHARRSATAACATDDPVLREPLAARLPRRRAAEAHLRPRALGRAARPGDGPGGQHREAAVERGRAAHRRGRVRPCSAPTRSRARGHAIASTAGRSRSRAAPRR